MNRAFAFNDPKIIKRLQDEFIPVAGNCADLQWSGSVPAKWFQDLANKTNWRTQPGNTMQGWYVAGADGSLYGWYNRRTAEDVARLLDRALKKYKEKPPAKVEIPAEEKTTEAGRMPAVQTVVRVFSRIRSLPEPDGAGELNKSIGRDHLWIFASDVQAILSAAEKAVGPFPLPAAFVHRLARFHLIDNVRGVPDAWQPEHIKTAQLSAKRTGAGAFSISGAFAQEYPDGSRGQEGGIEGEFEIDLAARKIVRFRAYYQGTAWGASRFTKADCPPGRFPLVIAMTETGDWVAKAVPPEFLGIGGYKPEK